MKKDLGLIPLINFDQLAKGIYRSGQPIHDFQWHWLKDTLKLKTAVNLRSENRDTDKHFCNLYGINLIEIPVRDHFAPTMQQANEFMEIIKNAKDFPLLIHCEHGHGRTSTFCILARIANGWKLNDAIKEEEKRFKFSFRHAKQEHFLWDHFDSPEKNKHHILSSTEINEHVESEKKEHFLIH